jgi:hypothetical protein
VENAIAFGEFDDSAMLAQALQLRRVQAGKEGGALDQLGQLVANRLGVFGCICRGEVLHVTVYRYFGILVSGR